MSEGIPEGIIRIVIGLVTLLIGWGIGFYDSKLRADKKIKQAEENARLSAQQAKGEAERAILMANSVAESRKQTLQGTTLLRLWLDSTKQPALDLDGQTVETAPLSETSKKRLVNLLGILRPWLDGKISTTPVPVPGATISPIPPVQTNGIPPVQAAAPGIKSGTPAVPLSIVEQIDEILQMRLAVSPLADRGIRLQESPEGGVIVWVGTKKFASVNEVTDPEVQAMIRAATAEWEKKYTPGM